MAESIVLYNYFRSSCSYRVRIALQLKGIPYTYMPVHLLKDGGEQHLPHYQKINPLKLVPTLVTPDIILSQSLAILEHIDEKYPSKPLLFPREGIQRYFVKELSEIINSSIQPLTNLGVFQLLEKSFSASKEQKVEWISHWVQKGFSAFESKIKFTHGAYSVGDEITAADLCLIPQVFSAERFEVSLDEFPLILKVYKKCMEHEAFIKAHPSRQPDAVKD